VDLSAIGRDRLAFVLETDAALDLDIEAHEAKAAAAAEEPAPEQRPKCITTYTGAGSPALKVPAVTLAEKPKRGGNAEGRAGWKEPTWKSPISSLEMAEKLWAGWRMFKGQSNGGGRQTRRLIAELRRASSSFRAQGATFNPCRGGRR
jgi:hypothetical protein